MSTVKFLKEREIHNSSSQFHNSSSITDDYLHSSSKFYSRNINAHYGCVNAIEFSNDGRFLLSGGDDRRVILCNVSVELHGKSNPIVMTADHNSNIFTVAFDSMSSKIFSGGNDEKVIVHDATTTKPIDFFPHEGPVYGISIDPYNDSVFATACEEGKLDMYDLRTLSSTLTIASVNTPFHSVVFHPSEPRLVLSANSKKGVSLWDVRSPRIALINYGGKNWEQSCMSARFNSSGSQILALRRRLPPIIYSTTASHHLYQFTHPGYYNSCTMKSGTFGGGRDEWVVGGSDNFDIFMWRVPGGGGGEEEENEEGGGVKNNLFTSAHAVLQGHRSIVNQVRYNPTFSLFASAGVEKIIKLWSQHNILCEEENDEEGQESVLDNLETPQRKIYSNTDYINLFLEHGQVPSPTHDLTRRSTVEDPRMLAFFDALIQRDLDGISDDDEEFIPNGTYTGLDSPLNSQPNSNRPEVSTEDGELDEIGRLIDNNEENEESKTKAEEDGTSNKTNLKTSNVTSNLLTQLIMSKQDLLLRLAKNYIKIELEGKGKVRKQRSSLLERLKKLNRRTHSLTMDLLPFPHTGITDSDSSTSQMLQRRILLSSSSTSLSSLTSSSSSSSSSSSDSDPHFTPQINSSSKLIPYLSSSSSSSSSSSNSSSIENQHKKLQLLPKQSVKEKRRRRLDRKIDNLKKSTFSLFSSSSASENEEEKTSHKNKKKSNSSYICNEEDKKEKSDEDKTNTNSTAKNSPKKRGKKSTSSQSESQNEDESNKTDIVDKKSKKNDTVKKSTSSQHESQSEEENQKTTETEKTTDNVPKTSRKKRQSNRKNDTDTKLSFHSPKEHDHENNENENIPSHSKDSVIKPSTSRKINDFSDDENKPCTSATALRRFSKKCEKSDKNDEEDSKNDKKNEKEAKHGKKERKDKKISKNPNIFTSSSSSSTSSSSSDENDDENDIYHLSLGKEHLSVLERLEAVSKRLKKVTADLTNPLIRSRRYPIKRKQQSTMIRATSSSSSSSSSSRIDYSSPDQSKSSIKSEDEEKIGKTKEFRPKSSKKVRRKKLKRKRRKIETETKKQDENGSSSSSSSK